MKEALVRISEIKLENFKNTNSGTAAMPSALMNEHFSRKSDILGIYGQNGSGKTAVIEAIGIVQDLLMGKSLSSEMSEYIGKEHTQCIITTTFAVETAEIQAKVVYGVQIQRISEGDFEITSESLASYQWNGENFEKKKSLLCFSAGDIRGRFTPGFRYNALVRSNEENKFNLVVARRIAQKEHCSVIFGKEGRQIFLSAPEDVSADYADIIRILHHYANVNLFVISSAHSGGISLNLLIPFAFRLDLGNTIAKGDLPVRLDAPATISKEHYIMMQQIMRGMNTVLGTLVPGLSIDIYDFGEQLLENGAVGHKIQLVSKRGDVTIPLKYESEGIIKIISILNVLMCVFNESSTCLVIDELDSGIYEYLLGELLSVFEKSAKGQLIFTSHNLRALEMLNKTSLVFSTTNPDNRYMRLRNVKTNHNLRDLYLRSITIGGQKEDVYAETDAVEIGRAFRRAGKVVHDGSNSLHCHCNLHLLFQECSTP